MAAPIDIANIKADLGIPPSDTSNDEWLQRRIDGVWARIETYTDRKLCAPPATFVDDWGLIAEAQRVELIPPAWGFQRNVSIFLRYFPVVSVDAISIDGGAGTAGDVRFDPNSGKLFSLRAGEWAWDMSLMLGPSRVKITYKAGWSAVPADLYEVVLGCLQSAWTAKQRQGAGIGGVTEIAVQDVGSVALGETNTFVQGSIKSGAADPLLGPYAAMLDSYIDHRSRIGWAGQPVTTLGP